jgi:ATP-dependent Clp protease ATP-binding subunit ClpA
MERAHPDVWEFFQEIFESGEARDSKGGIRDFRNYLFLLTGGELSPKRERNSIGFGVKAPARRSRPALTPGQTRFGPLPPEFCSRLDAIIEFAAPSVTDYDVMFGQEMERLVREMQESRECRLILSPDVKAGIMEAAGAYSDGYRGFLRAFEDRVAMPLRHQIAGKGPGCILEVGWTDGALILNPTAGMDL